MKRARVSRREPGASTLFVLALALGSWETVGAQAREAMPQRPSFTTDTSVTFPGTLELELGASASEGSWSLPATLKFTPSLESTFLRRLEWSASFDAWTKPSGEMGELGDRVVVAARRELLSRGPWSLGLAPQLGLFTRDAQGIRYGLLGIAVFRHGASTFIGNAAVSGASRASEDNPERQLDLAFDVTRPISPRFAWLAGLQYEWPHSGVRTLSLGQGLTFRWTPTLYLDAAIRQVDLLGDDARLEALFGMTVNFGSLLE